MKLGFIGSGNMAKAMIKGIIASGIVQAGDITAADSKADALGELVALGVRTTPDNLTAAANTIVFLSVKPQVYPQVIAEIKEAITPATVIVTIAPGWTLEKLRSAFGKDVKIIRAMPNTPAMSGEGMSAVCPNDAVSGAELQFVSQLFSCFGKCETVPEKLMDVVGAVSGSSPAFAFMFIEALADGAVAEGMPREQAYKFAAQAVLGSAKMVLESGKHPGMLKDMVCSPGGTTIEGVQTLESGAFRGTVMKAVRSCVEKSQHLA